jgi:anti-anti-sigma factor
MGSEVRNSELSSQVRVVGLLGRLDINTTEVDAPVLQTALNDSAAGVIVDMDAVAFISSSGLRMLLAAERNARATGKRFALVRTKPLIYKIFKVAGLSEAFHFFDSEAEAVNALSR